MEDLRVRKTWEGKQESSKKGLEQRTVKVEF